MSSLSPYLSSWDHNSALLKPVITEIRSRMKQHRDGDKTVTRTVAAGIRCDENAKIVDNPPIFYAQNRVPELIEHSFNPLDQILDYGVSFADDDNSQIYKQRQASATIHSEVRVQGDIIVLEQICCPRCAAFIALAGYKMIVYGVDAITNEWRDRRHAHSQNSQHIFQKAGLSVRTLDPDDDSNNNPNELWHDGDTIDYDPSIFFWHKFTDEPFDFNAPSARAKLIEQASKHLELIPQLNPFFHYAAFAAGYDASSKRYFTAICTPSLPPGLSIKSYLENLQTTDQNPATKYSPVIPPLSATRAMMLRHGIKAQNLSMGTTSIPTSRDLINTMGLSELDTLHITHHSPDEIKDIIENQDENTREAIHKKNKLPYRIHDFESGFRKIYKASGKISF